LRPKPDSHPLPKDVLANGYSLSRIAPNGDGVSLAISGEINIANAEAFSDEAHSLCEGADGQLTLDLQNCVFIDSAGIRVLIALGEEQRARGGTLKLSVSGEPLRVLELSGLLDSDLFAIDCESAASPSGS
jgi:anti-anti-sigma factor